MFRHALGWDDWKAEWRHAVRLAAIYFVCAVLTVKFTRFEGGVAMIWISTGILCVDLRHRPHHSRTIRLFCCGIASIIATAFFGLGPYAAVPLAIINMAEAIGCVWLLNRFMPGARGLRTPQELATLFLIAGVIVPGLSAGPAAAIADLAKGVPFGSNLINWYCGHALGSLTVMPLAKLAMGGDLRGFLDRANRRDWLDVVLLLAAVVGSATLVFTQSTFPLLFLPFLPMIVTVFRFGRIGATIGLTLVAAIGIFFTARGVGPITLIHGSVGTRVQFFHFYLACLLLTCLAAAAELKRRKQMFARLQESTALYQVIADRTGDILMAVEVDGTVRFVSPSIRKITGFAPEDLCGRRAHETVISDDFERVVMTHRQAVANPDETFICEFRAPMANGKMGWFDCHTRATIDDDGAVTGAVNVIREISERKAREHDLANAAQTDPLTGALNRRGLFIAYDQLLERRPGAPGCVAMFDLDHFKGINDRFGHATGDDVLRLFVELLNATVRGSDFIGRLGGEEFAVLLIGADLEKAQAVCDRVRARMSMMPITARDGQEFRVTVSAGLAVIDRGIELSSAMEAADVALYSAKMAGRNRLAIAA